ncbi:hypothetical protein SAMN03080610_02462 [Afifella marina DSM 2698]|uniref:Uncharacterized protein n=1 Tax=Afifella marina DSM 2698 TaxID=1120955 RepID=A0A1G5NS13_AFIMA|nr:hypothetical protein SAMN03080610_02462 [Afifella marina DSM 2698]
MQISRTIVATLGSMRDRMLSLVSECVFKKPNNIIPRLLKLHAIQISNKP